MTEFKYSVYRHTAPNGKTYIGITCQDVKRRWKNGSSYRNNPHFYSAIQKHGWHNFTHEVLASGLSKTDACDMEMRLIAELCSTDPHRGYNRSKGGDKTTAGYAMSDETKRKISAAKTGKANPFTDEHRRRIGEALTGHAVSDETRAKLRAALGDRFRTPRAVAKQKANTPRGANHHKATPVVCLDTGEVFPTIRAAAEACGSNRNSIARCCAGNQTTAARKRWAFIGVERTPDTLKAYVAE